LLQRDDDDGLPTFDFIVADDLVSILWISFCRDLQKSCQMTYFQTKNIDLGKFWTVLQ
jgi:hypothetical protein